jgi:hypothetical protein
MNTMSLLGVQDGTGQETDQNSLVLQVCALHLRPRRDQLSRKGMPFFDVLYSEHY